MNENYDEENYEYSYQDIRNSGKVEKCLLDEAFKREQSKPIHLRRTSFMISCPCSKCNPARMVVPRG
jgi:hypothetical protein